MKFIKKSPITLDSPMADRFSVLPDDRIVTTTKVSMQMPVGGDTERPGIYSDGQVRYSTTLDDFEVYNGNGQGLGWEVVRTVRPAPITLCPLGVGDYVKVEFGPLLYKTGEPYDPRFIDRPENVMVYVENVWQIPKTNYELVINSNAVWVRFGEAPPLNKPVNVLLGFDGYFPPFPAA